MPRRFDVCYELSIYLTVTPLLLLNVLSAAPQQTSHDHPMVPTLPIIANGSKHPEAISDEIAYRHFIMSACASRTPQPHEAARRVYLLNHLRLSPADERAFVAALDGVQEDIDALNWSEDSPLLDASSRQQKLSHILDSAVETLNVMLTADGQAKIADWVNTQVKQNTLIVGTAAQNR